MKKKIIVISQIAATYIGTVVGAGFATGQEILQFFAVHYVWGIVGILLSTFLFIWLGTKMMLFSHRLGAYSYQQFNQHLFGRRLGNVVNVFVFIILFGVTAVMLSGTGSIFEEQIGWSYQLGILLTILLCYIVMLKGLNGLYFVNSLVVPMMLLFGFLIASMVLIEGLGLGNGLKGSFAEQAFSLEWSGWEWIKHALTYVAFNLAMAQAVLVPLGKEVRDERLIKWGGLWGGIGLGFMLIASHLALQSVMPSALEAEIPMALILSHIGWIILVLFIVVIYGEVFTTLIGNVFGITRQIHTVYEKLPEKWVILMILLTSFVISQIGFSSLVQYLYPLFGYLGLVLLLFLAVKRLPEKR